MKAALVPGLLTGVNLFRGIPRIVGLGRSQYAATRISGIVEITAKTKTKLHKNTIKGHLKKYLGSLL